MININSSNFVSNGISLYNVVSNLVNGGGANFSNFTGETFSLVNRESNADIWSFLSAFENGVAKPTKFRLEMSLPKGANGSMVNVDSRAGNIRAIERELNVKDSVSIKCHTMSVPRRGFNTFEVTQNNIKFKMPYGISYEPVTFSFYADAQLDTVRYFEIWQAAIMNYSDNTINFFDEYTSDVTLFIIDDEGNDVYSVKLIQTYPTNLAPIELSYGNVNNLLNVNVTFNYRYFISGDSTQRVNRAF